jgi:hypothetical protein
MLLGVEDTQLYVFGAGLGVNAFQERLVNLPQICNPENHSTPLGRRILE